MPKLKFIFEKNIIYLTSPSLQNNSLFLAFTTRIGGLSKPPYDSLNLAFHVGDNEKKVRKNRLMLSKKLNFEIEKFTCAKQTHGCKTKFISHKDIGRGATGFEMAIKSTDSLITDMPGVALGMFYADCLPVVIVSTKPKIVSVVHAGYKGLLAGVIENTLKELSKKTQTNKLIAFLGPSIGQCCYKVGADRIKVFHKRFPSVVSMASQTLNLKLIAESILESNGLKSSSIIKSNICTSCRNNLFYSYRRNSTTGRHAALAYIMKD